MLIDFLSDTIAGMESFKDDVSTVFVFDDGTQLRATGNHPNRLLFYETSPLADLTGQLEGPIYIGALGYLRSLLGSKLMKDTPELRVSYVDRNGSRYGAAIQFSAKNLEAHFECTNPEILNEKDRVRKFPKPADAIFFPFTKDMRKQFDEVARFSTPKSDVRLFTLQYDGKSVRAIFGSGKNVSKLILTDQITGQTGQKIEKLVSLDRFRAMIKLTAENDGRAGFHGNAVWVDFTTPIAIHTVVIPTMRDKNL